MRIATTVPRPNDVLLGRNSLCWHHEGNVEFRKLIAKHHLKYKACKARQNKSAIIEEIIKTITESGGRILLPKEMATEKHWVVVSEAHVIRSKISNALRDKFPSPSMARQMAKKKNKEMVAKARRMKKKKKEQQLKKNNKSQLPPGFPLPIPPALSFKFPPAVAIQTAALVSGDCPLQFSASPLFPGKLTNSAFMFQPACFSQPIPSVLLPPAHSDGSEQSSSDETSQEEGIVGGGILSAWDTLSSRWFQSLEASEKPKQQSAIPANHQDDGLHDDGVLELFDTIPVECL